MSPELENLMNMAFADGQITDKEREILLRKAEKLGEDVDEVEMILEGRLALMKKEQTKMAEQQAITSNQQTQLHQIKSNKEGEIKKCPACGAPFESFNTKCVECGHEFRNIEANASIQKLFQMLNDVEAHRKENSSNNPLKALGSFYAKALGGGGSVDKINNQKKEIIRGFPIPTTKEDIIEFLALALPNAKEEKRKSVFESQESYNVRQLQHEFAQVWKAKCEQIIMKARFSMKEDKRTLEEINNYAKELGI